MGVERDLNAAVNYFERAADRGNIEAQANLGMLHSKGLGVSQNVTLAIEYLTLAKEQGSAQALNVLGYMHMNGIGFPIDQEKGFKYIEEAASWGHIGAMTNSGVFYLNGLVVDTDYDKAFALFTVAAQQQFTPAIFNLALMRLYGLGVPQNYPEALKLLLSTVQRGEYAQYVIRAHTFYSANDIEGAYLSYSLAALLGFESAQLSLAYLWEKRLAPYSCKHSKDYCRNLYLYQAAVNSGNSLSLEKLGDALYETNPMEAYKFYTLADSPRAKFARGYMHEHGVGVPKDTLTAQGIYTEILLLAEQRKIEPAAVYPAKIALWALYLRSLVVLNGLNNNI